MGRMRLSATLASAAALGLLLASCSRPSGAPAATRTARAADDAAALAADRPERLVMPLAPAGAGRMVVERVAVERIAPAHDSLVLESPLAEPGEPPAPAPEASSPDTASLKPPIARGLPSLPSGGRGGRVTLDVRVDETGEVSDVELVETDADSATVIAATRAAFGVSYHPAVLGKRRVAVWCRQVFDEKRGR